MLATPSSEIVEYYNNMHSKIRTFNSSRILNLKLCHAHAYSQNLTMRFSASGKKKKKKKKKYMEINFKFIKIA
jgi:hypothetical protein